MSNYITKWVEFFPAYGDDNIDKKISMSEYFKKINKEELKKELKKVL